MQDGQIKETMGHRKCLFRNHLCIVEAAILLQTFIAKHTDEDLLSEELFVVRKTPIEVGQI